MSTPTVPDGPDTETIREAEQWHRDRPGDLLDISTIDAGVKHAATLARAWLTRPAAGRDLTEYRAMMDFGPRWMTVTKDEAAAELRRGRRVQSRSVSPWRAAQPDDALGGEPS